MDRELVEGSKAEEAADFLRQAIQNNDILAESPLLNRFFQSMWYQRELLIVGSRASGKSRLFQHIKREEFSVDDPNPSTIAPVISKRENIESQVFAEINDFGGDESLDDPWMKFIFDHLPFAVIVVVDLVGLIDEDGKFNPSSNNLVPVRDLQITATARSPSGY